MVEYRKLTFKDALNGMKNWKNRQEYVVKKMVVEGGKITYIPVNNINEIPDKITKLIAEKQKKLEQLKKDISDCSKKIINLDKEKNRKIVLEKELIDLKSKIDEKSTYINDLQNKIHDNETFLAKLSCDIEELKDTENKLNKTNEHLLATNEQLVLDNEQLLFDNDQILSNNLQLSANNVYLVKENGDISAVNENLQTTNENLQTENANLQTENANLKTVNDKLRTENERLQNEKLKNNNEKLKNDNEKLQKDNEKLQKDNDKLRTENEKLQKNNNSIIDEITKKEKTLAEMIDEEIEKRKCFPEMELECVEKERELAKIRETINSMKKTQQELNLQIQQTRQKIKPGKKSKNKAKPIPMKNEINVKTLDTAIERIKTELEVLNRKISNKNIILEKIEKTIQLYVNELCRVKSRLHQTNNELDEVRRTVILAKIDLSKLNKQIEEKYTKLCENIDELPNTKLNHLANYLAKQCLEKTKYINNFIMSPFGKDHDETKYKVKYGLSQDLISKMLKATEDNEIWTRSIIKVDNLEFMKELINYYIVKLLSFRIINEKYEIKKANILGEFGFPTIHSNGGISMTTEDYKRMIVTVTKKYEDEAIASTEESIKKMSNKKSIIKAKKQRDEQIIRYRTDVHKNRELKKMTEQINTKIEKYVLPDFVDNTISGKIAYYWVIRRVIEQVINAIYCERNTKHEAIPYLGILPVGLPDVSVTYRDNSTKREKPVIKYVAWNEKYNDHDFMQNLFGLSADCKIAETNGIFGKFAVYTYDFGIAHVMIMVTPDKSMMDLKMKMGYFDTICCSSNVLTPIAIYLKYIQGEAQPWMKLLGLSGDKLLNIFKRDNNLLLTISCIRDMENFILTYTTDLNRTYVNTDQLNRSSILKGMGLLTEGDDSITTKTFDDLGMKSNYYDNLNTFMENNMPKRLKEKVDELCEKNNNNDDDNILEEVTKMVYGALNEN